MKKRNSIMGDLAYALANIGMTAAAVVVGGGLILSEAAHEVLLNQDAAMEQLGIAPDYLPVTLRDKGINVSFRDNLGPGGYRVFFGRSAEDAKSFKTEGDYARLRLLNGQKICDVFSATNTTNTDALFAQHMGLDAHALDNIVNPKELTAFVLMHEFRHCAQDPGNNQMAQEAEADNYAIRAIEAKNPGSHIRDVVTTWRAVTNNHGNALALNLFLTDAHDWHPGKVEAAEKTFQSLQKFGLGASVKDRSVTADDHIQIAKAIVDGPENDTLVRQRAQLEINAYQWLVTNAAAQQPQTAAKTAPSNPVRPG